MSEQNLKVYYCSLFNELHLILPVGTFVCGTLIDDEWIELHLPRNNWHYIGEF